MPEGTSPAPTRTTTPSVPSQESTVNVLAGWALTGLKSKLLVPDLHVPTNGAAKSTPAGLKGLGSQGDVNPWHEEEENGAPARGNPVGGMKLSAKGKSVVEKVVLEEEEESNWPALEEWGDEEEKDGWGFDDE
jgi:hypothetical protein